MTQFIPAAGRKFYMAVLTLLICTALELHLKSGISDNFLWLACGLNGIYISGNVARKHIAENGGK